MTGMRLLRRSRKDDVDVDSFLANLHRIAHIATIPFRKVIDLRSESGTDAPEDGAEEPAPTRAAG
jgi:hypothetical protein